MSEFYLMTQARVVSFVELVFNKRKAAVSPGLSDVVISATHSQLASESTGGEQVVSEDCSVYNTVFCVGQTAITLRPALSIPFST